MNNEYKKIVEYLMAKGYSKLEAKRLAQQATTQLAMSRLAMMEAVIQIGIDKPRICGIIKCKEKPCLITKTTSAA